jgi:hypothetical protein
MRVLLRIPSSLEHVNVFGRVGRNELMWGTLGVCSAELYFWSGVHDCVKAATMPCCPLPASELDVLEMSSNTTITQVPGMQLIHVVFGTYWMSVLFWSIPRSFWIYHPSESPAKE